MVKVRPTDWTPRKRSEVLGLSRGQRHSIRQIAKITLVPKSTVADIIKRDNPNHKVKCGRPKVLSDRDMRRIDLYIKRDKETRRQTAKAIIHTLGLECSVQTFVRATKKLGYRRCAARRRPLLKKIDYKRRLQFAKEHKDWTVDDWKRVIFTDESIFKVGMERLSVTYVWRKRGEEFHRDCVEPKIKQVGTGLMFWGSFRLGKLGPGLFFQLEPGQKINSTVYRDQILLGPLQQFAKDSESEIPHPIVMEDNAPVHKGVCTSERKRLNWEPYLHPPNSPDLNPIENIWAYMKRKVAEKGLQITSHKQMKEFILGIWNSFSDTQWDALIASMPNRMKAVIKAKGGHTGY